MRFYSNCGKYKNEFIFWKYVDLFEKLDKGILSIILWCLVKHYLPLWTGKIIVTKNIHFYLLIYLLTNLLIYLLTYSLTVTHSLTQSLTFSTEHSLLGTLTGFQLVKKFPAFCGTRKFITAFTVPDTCPYPEHITST